MVPSRGGVRNLAERSAKRQLRATVRQNINLFVTTKCSDGWGVEEKV